MMGLEIVTGRRGGCDLLLLGNWYAGAGSPGMKRAGLGACRVDTVRDVVVMEGDFVVNLGELRIDISRAVAPYSRT